MEVTRDAVVQACDRLGVTSLAFDAALPDVPQYPAPDVRAQPDLEELDEDPNNGELLYVPSRPVGQRQREVRLELQNYQGKRALLAYTSREQLEAGCGPYQPWVAIESARLDVVMEQCGAEGVLFNPELGEEARHTGPVHDWTGSRSGGR